MFKSLQPAPPSDTLCSRPPDSSATWFVASCRSKRRRHRLASRSDVRSGSNDFLCKYQISESSAVKSPMQVLVRKLVAKSTH